MLFNSIVGNMRYSAISFWKNSVSLQQCTKHFRKVKFYFFLTFYKIFLYSMIFCKAKQSSFISGKRKVHQCVWGWAAILPLRLLANGISFHFRNDWPDLINLSDCVSKHRGPQRTAFPSLSLKCPSTWGQPVASSRLGKNKWGSWNPA